MTNFKSKRILVSWYCDPSQTRIPPFRLSDNQVTSGPKLGTGPEFYDFFTPHQRVYDLYEAARSQGFEDRFDAVVVFSDSSLMNLPLNLKAFQCPTVLCLGDTHHLDRPIQRMVAYALDARFDFVVSNYNRQHVHWFQEAGMQQTAWIPGLAATHVPRPFQHRHKRVGFVGQIGNVHPRRAPMFRAMEEANTPIIAGKASRTEAADLYASSILSFNASLNGDVNLRVFEVMSAAGCLLTDRLSPESGLPLLFEEGKEFIGYDSIEELLDRAHHYLRNPTDSLRIAKAGHAAYLERFLPEHQAQRLLDWVFNGRLPDFNNPGWDCRPQIASQEPVPLPLRVQLYEYIQAAHLSHEHVRVLIAPEVPLSVAADMLDLRRVQCCLLDASQQKRERLAQFGLGKRVSYLSHTDAMSSGNWYFMIAGDTNIAIRQIPHHKLVLLPLPKQQSSAA